MYPNWATLEATGSELVWIDTGPPAEGVPPAVNPERVIVTTESPVIDAAAVVMTMEVAPGVLIGVKATPAVEIDPVGESLVRK
jgi:hypothetical protein